jgi:PAS domain S-box-containing protein
MEEAVLAKRSVLTRRDPARDAISRFVADTPLNAVMLDRDGFIVEVSPTMLGETDILRRDLIGARVETVFGGATNAEALLAACAATGGVTFPPRCVLVRGGEETWVESVVTVWRDRVGEVGGVLVVNRNITAQQRALADLRRTEALLDAIVESIPSMLSVQDVQAGGFVRVNKATEDFTGVTRDKLISHKPLQQDAEALARRMAAVEAARVGGGSATEETVTPRRGGSRTLQVRRRVIQDKDGKELILSVAEDITEKKQVEADLQAALAEAEAANRAKSAFLANMSHEIRTPLNGVLGMAQAMARDELPPVQRERLDVVRQSGETLLTILNDILDLSKIEAGKLEMESIDFDLAAVVAGAVGGYAAVAEAKGLSFVVELGGAEGIYRGDPTRVRQVISNLISNAVKFSDQGAVRVTVRRETDAVSFTVLDRGPGIEPAVLGRLFEKFVQADATTTRRFGGTGLGLAICRELAWAMGGTISAESVVGEGASFTLTLPLLRVGDAAPVSASVEIEPAADGSLRILAAEDNPINQLVLKTILEQAGLSVTIVGDGRLAVEAYRAGGWDLILMDVQMPVMDGVDATRAIRKLERDEARPRTPIIALTANAMEHQTAEYLTCGMDRLVAKPLQISDLFSAIDTLVREPVVEARRAAR